MAGPMGKGYWSNKVLIMAKIEFEPKDVKNVKPKVDELVKGQSYPFQATVRHAYKRGIVLGRSDHYEIIPKDTDVVLTIQSPEQAWNVCADLAYLADFHKVEKFGSLTVAAPKAAPKVPAAEVTA